MSGLFNIEEVDSSTNTAMPNDIKKERLELLLNEIENTQTISKSDVISLEAFLGEPIITGKFNINTFSTMKTTVNANGVKKLIQSKIHEIPLTKEVTREDIASEARKLGYELQDLIYELNDIFTMANIDDLKNLFNDSNSIYYDDNDNLCDIRTISLYESLNTWKSRTIFKNVLNDKYFERFLDKWNETSRSGYIRFKLLEMYKQKIDNTSDVKKLMIMDISINDVIDYLVNIKNVTDSLNKLTSEIKELANIYSGNKRYGSYNDDMKYYHKIIEHIGSIIKDDLTVPFIYALMKK